MSRTAVHAQLNGEGREQLPESKLELIAGKLIAGNSLAGSRSLLRAIIQSCGPQVALPFASGMLWCRAVAEAFSAPPSLSCPGDWARWTAQIRYSPTTTSAGSGFSWHHHRVYSLLLLGLHQALRAGREPAPGSVIQRFVMRVGEDGLLPDLQVFRRDRLHHLHSHYCDGPADLVVEVALPGHEAQDREVKGRLYADGGVPEYWLLDPGARRAEVLMLRGGRYAAQTPAPDGRYHSAVLPGLTLDTARLWHCIDARTAPHAAEEGMIMYTPAEATIGPSTAVDEREPRAWEWRSYAPPVGLQPTPIRFEQLIEWCPEASFELLDGVPHIGGWDGTRQVLGLLLMTFGLAETVTLLHPRQWIAAVREAEEAQRHDAARRDAWWGRAHEAAALLRERFGAGQVVVLGDLVQPRPLTFWSTLTLVASGLRASTGAVPSWNLLPGLSHSRAHAAGSLPTCGDRHRSLKVHTLRRR